MTFAQIRVPELQRSNSIGSFFVRTPSAQSDSAFSKADLAFPRLILQNISPSSDQYPRSCAPTRSVDILSLCSRQTLHLPDSSLSGGAATGIFFNVRLLCDQLSFHVSPLCALGQQCLLLIDRGPA